MISTDIQRVQLQSIVANQLPSFVKDDFPLLADFLKEYYISQEFPGASVDLIQNIDEYLKLESLTNNAQETELGADISYNDTTITVAFDLSKEVFGTYQFPDRDGLIQIGNEIILYSEKTKTSFTGCRRGFSGVTSYQALNNTDQLTFSTSTVAKHKGGDKIVNLSALLFNEFLLKIKNQLSPGFENRTLADDLNQRLFISKSKDFYQAKGTDESFKMLFGALYGEPVEVLKPQNFVFRPSDADYRITKDLVVEPIDGDPSQLLNSTLFQDAYSNYDIDAAYSPISAIEKITYNSKDYFKLSLDFNYAKDIPLQGSIYGEFTVHPNTKVITPVAIGASVIDVDSTIGFPASGELAVGAGILTYRSKSINQFYGVGVANTTDIGTTSAVESKADIRLNVNAYAYVGIGTTTKVTVKIGSVLAEPVIQNDTYYYSVNDTAKVQSLGITTSGPKVDNWFYNVATQYDVKSITLVDSSDFTYTIETYTDNNFRLGDTVTVTDSLGNRKDSIVNEVINALKFSIRGQGSLPSIKSVQRNITRAKVDVALKDYYYIDNYFANIQNTYVDFDRNVLVASPSIPNYFNGPLDFYDKKVTLTGSYSGDTFTVLDVNDHGYYTGDSVYYNSFDIISEDFLGNESISVSKFPEINPGIFFVKRVNKNQFQLATSPSNINNNNFVSVSGIVTSNTIQYIDYFDKKVDNQLLLREIKEPDNKSGSYVTEPGSRTGILVNGVEILNYKSKDTVYYGPLNKINISAEGKDYDILNPPLINIEDTVGSGATAIAAIRGNLNAIDIVDPGFDYVSDPIITITGGNGVGAEAFANTILATHDVSFNAFGVKDSDSARINLDADTIGFSTYHKFRNGEKVIYKPDGGSLVSGITTDAVYYVHTVGVSTVKLYTTQDQAISAGIETVSLTAYGTGIQRLQSFDRKRVLSNIIIKNSGTGYENKKRTIISATGINTALNQIHIDDHGYQSGEIIQYSYDKDRISGINSNTQYLVTEVDNNSFRLSSVGLGTTAKSYYYDNNEYIDFTIAGLGTGTHSFNYEPITVDLSGEIGVATVSGQDFRAKIQPLFRGYIDSVQIINSGNSYGSSEILNYDRQPLVTTKTGTGAQVTPVINNGKLVDVLVVNEGFGYNSPPSLELETDGAGKYAQIVPVLKDGQLKSVRIHNAGIGYTNRVIVDVIPSGSNAKFKADINNWTVNLFEKSLDIISSDDGILDEAENQQLGIQYTHLYAPRKLRESLYVRNQNNDIKYGLLDLERVDGQEVTASYHSPIIGWAYDGNPIYGPYGYTTPTGGAVRAMKSGYKAVTSDTRPPLSNFHQGFFVEDFVFDNAGDLDEYNGRFCVTPDYPNGVYAYFATINPGNVESSGPFNKYKIPQFPYLIGNSFHSKPNSFNYTKTSNQNDYDLNSSEWFRNTTPYALTKNNASYDFLVQPNKKKTPIVDIKVTSSGQIDNVGILTGGNNYQVGEKILFETLRGSQNAKAQIKEVEGKEVTNISVATSSITNLEISPYDSNGTFVAISTLPHDFVNKNLVSLSGFNTSISSLEGSFNIGVRTETLNLTGGVSTTGVTGLVTYFGVSGSLNSDLLSIGVNDTLGIGTEDVKVLAVDRKNYRLRVLRAQNNTISIAHTATSVITEDSRKFTYESLPQNDVTFELNREIYFEPKEALGVGTITGVGIGTTISFSNAGAGLTQIYIQTESIFLPDHELNTGDVLTYYNNGGDSIGVSTDGHTAFTLPNKSTLYVGKISNDLIGISTFKVGIGTTGTFVGVAATSETRGLLRFTGFGTGVYHSFETDKDNVVTAEVTKNVVTVATASTHALLFDDNVTVTVQPGIITSVTVKYNEFNRRIVFDPKDFASGDVDVTNNTISLSDHKLNSGDKVIYTASTAAGGLENNKIYYIFRQSKNKVKLCLTRHQAVQFTPEVVDITSAAAGTLSPINPPIDVYNNNTVNFNLSDSSLGSKVGVSSVAAFDFSLYSDSNYSHIFKSTTLDDKFEVTKTGTVGVSNDAELSLVVADGLPSVLYYKFTPINTDNLSETKKGIVIDKEVDNYSKINVKESVYAGEFAVTGTGVTTIFDYNIIDTPERSSYSSAEAKIKYSTDSAQAYGGIAKVELKYKGNNYSEIVGVSSIKSGIGTKAVLEPSSVSIGEIVSTNIEDIGFDYPSDNTLRPVLNLPEVLQIESLTSFDSIGISSVGKNYTIAPNLVVIDGFTGAQVKDVDIEYEIGDSTVTILKNTFGMNAVTPSIIPTANINGIGINTISYDMSTKEVTVAINTSFSSASDVPLFVGDKVLIENISVGLGTTGTGYNSLNYGYSLFELTKTHFPLGGNVGVVTYSLDGYIEDNIFPGNFDRENSAGIIVPQKYFPQFDISLKTNNFLNGEKVTSGNISGNVENWNNKIELLKVSTDSEFSVGDIIVGETSHTQGKVTSKIDFNAEIKLEAGSVVKKGWTRDTGFLNNNLERLPDNNYYQNFSYSLKSSIDYDTWNEPVHNLNHPTGFLKFADLQVVSTDDSSSGVNADEADLFIFIDSERVVDINCYSAFDLVTENSLSVSDTQTISDEIYFNSKELTDYFRSVGNRALVIDDFSSEFNSDPRGTKFSTVDTFDLDQRSVKYVTLIKDATFTGERQVVMVSLLNDGTQMYVNNYGKEGTVSDLGWFDGNISGTEGELLFYPTKFANNNYNVSAISFGVLGISTAGIGTTTLGTSVDIRSSTASVPANTTTTVVGIASTYRSSKIIVQISGDDGNFEYDELNVIHNGTTVDLMEYSQLTTHSVDEYGAEVGLGTYAADMTDGDINIDFIPTAGIACTVNTLRISIASTLSTGVGTQYLGSGDQDTGFLNSSYTHIASAGSPVAHKIAQYGINNTSEVDDNNAAYYVISVEDTANEEYEMIEVIVVNDSSEAYITEYGNVTTNEGAVYSGLGTVGAAVSTTTSHTQLFYTPNAGIGVSVRVFQAALQIAAENSDIDSVDGIDLGTAEINAGYGVYEGTEIDVKRAFNLQHNQKNIFSRNFDASDSTIVNVTDNTVTLPDHFFVTGEEVTYAQGGTPISIASTTISGIGVTTLLPSNIFLVKIDNQTVKFAKTAQDALKEVPNILELSAVGVGAAHTIFARNQNTKCLVAIDNAIQSPLVSTAVTTGITSEIGIAQRVVSVSGVTSFFGGDLLKINDEIMKVNTVGYGTTNAILVERPWMGTNLGIHTENSLVTKVDGDYHIVNNQINFIAAPQGPVPVSSTTNPPDSRDWVGITTHSTFQGRSFMRSGIEGSSKRTYETNYLFDDISHEFNGISTAYTLKVNGENVAGFSTDNGVVLINGIFQGPTGDLLQSQDYSFVEGTTGISSVVFAGVAASVASDPQSGSIPVGGMIVSVGSTEGLGYQPLVAAGGTAVVSAAGTISSISIGNTGSGYRVGVQTNVRVAIQTGTNIAPILIGIGTAAITNGHITGIAITNNQVIYVPRSISDVGYSSVTGVTTVTTSSSHGLLVGQEVKLSGIAFTCDYLPAVGVQSAVYTASTGIMTVTTSTAHGLSVSGKASDVILTGLAFTCSLDNGGATHTYPRTTDPAYGGTPVTGVASVTQFTINVGISTVPTFYVSGGTIQPALIAPRSTNNSDSGVDPAFQGSTVLTIVDNTSFTINSGVSTRAHFYARGGRVDRAMDVIIDEPLSYYDMPLIYSGDSPGGASVGVGTQATVNVVVGQGSSVVSFEVLNEGYAYANNQVLTVAIGGTTGIPTDTTKTFREFQVTIEDIISDEFSAWHFGNLEVLDKIESEFDGSTRSFTLKRDKDPVTIRAEKGSDIDVQSTLLVFLNDILQVPGDGYTLSGGSVLTFASAPRGPQVEGSFKGDTCKILFYKGTGDQDVIFNDIRKSVKTGDMLTIRHNKDLCARSIKQDPRLVEDVVATNIVDTNAYVGMGINGSPDCQRPVTWCKQTADLVVNGQVISKSREEDNVSVYPTTVIIQSVGVGSTVIFTESLKPFFDPDNENQGNVKTQKVSITSQDNIVGAAATAIVSIAGTISSVSVSYGGTGYTSAPDVIIGTPVGLGTTTRASATATLTGDAVSSITVTSPGTGYTIATPPEVLIEVPSLTREVNTTGTYAGDFGEIIGVSTTSVGVASTGVVFDFFIPPNSDLRDTALVGTAVTISGIQTGYYFTVSNSNIGSGLTSLYQNSSVLGIGTAFIDNVYEVAAVSVAQTSTPGIALTYVAQVTVSVDAYNGLINAGLGYSEFFGNFSWGRIEMGARSSPEAFTAYTNNGFTGLSTSAVISRVTPLRSKDYTS